jgi:hypothetical protein
VSLEFAMLLAETSTEKLMDDELIRLCAAPVRIACLRMSPQYLSWSGLSSGVGSASTTRRGSVGAQTQHQSALDLSAQGGVP